MKQKLRALVPVALAIAVAVTLTAGGCAKKTEDTSTDTEKTVEKIDENRG